jgi:hypothetical protein
MRRALFVCWLVVAALGCSRPIDSPSGSPCDIECKKQRALSGDVVAAEEVATSLHMPASYFWTGIAAQNGSADQAYAYALVLTVNGTRSECYRALYWAKRASDSGSEQAKGLLKRLEGQQRKTSFSCGCPEPPPGNLPLKSVICPTTADSEKYVPSS